MTDVGGADGNSQIVSTLGESVTFANPTASLTINAGTGDDTITVTSIDAAFRAAVRAGLKVYRSGKRSFLLGSDLIAFVTRTKEGDQ